MSKKTPIAAYRSMKVAVREKTLIELWERHGGARGTTEFVVLPYTKGQSFNSHWAVFARINGMCYPCTKLNRATRATVRGLMTRDQWLAIAPHASC